MPTLVKFMLLHALVGFALAIVFVGAILALDIGGIATLAGGSSSGALAIFLLTFFTGLTFGGVQMGFAVMSRKAEEDEDGQNGHHDRVVDAWELQPVPVTVTKLRKGHL